MIELCLFRHGRTEWNALGKYQGQADVGLDDLGRLQAQAVARRVKEIAPTLIYSSDLSRCADVAKAAGDLISLDVKHDVLLRERDVGTWSGLTRDEVNAQFPEDFDAWTRGDENVYPGGGESAAEVITRIDEFIAKVRSSGAQGPVVAVTHAAWIRSVLPWLFGKNFPRRSVGVPTQGSLTVLRLEDDGTARLEAYNDRGHLLEVEDIDHKAPAPTIY